MKKYLFIAMFFTAVIGFAQTNLKVSNFSKIKIHASAQVEVIYSNTNKVMLSANDEEMKSISVNSENNMLEIKQNGKAIPGLRIRIYTNQLKGMELIGTGKLTMDKFNYLDNLYVSLEGKYMVNTGEAKIKNLIISRDALSKVVYSNAIAVKESVDGVMLAVK